MINVEGYLEYRGYSAPWKDIMSAMEDILSTMGDILSTVGDIQYRGEIS